ncbi:MAG: LysR family transcriptional regulator [Polyangiaceae bacterium]
MEWLNFRHLYAFWMVARGASFTKAASEMHVAQSAVSAQVAALEEYVGEQLLIRSHRSVELTPAGHRLLGYANSIFEQSRAINTLVRDKEHLAGSVLRVGIVGGVSRNFVYRLLERYQARAPGVRLSVTTGSYGELYEFLRRFEIDAIVSLDLPKKQDLSEVAYRKLGESRMCIVGVPKLIRALRRKRSKLSIEAFSFRHPYEVDVVERYVRPMIHGEMTLRLDTDDIPLLRFFANSGHGVAVLPRVGVLEDLEAGSVEAIELAACPEVMIYGITMVRSRSALVGVDMDGLWE